MLLQDRKEQKSLFREILKYVEDEADFYEKHACSDNREHLEILSWANKIQYDAIQGVRRDRNIFLICLV